MPESESEEILPYLPLQQILSLRNQALHNVFICTCIIMLYTRILAAASTFFIVAIATIFVQHIQRCSDNSRALTVAYPELWQQFESGN